MAEKQKLCFNGQSYAVKGRLCHAIVKYYVEQNPEVTLKDLQKVFNTEKNMIVVSYDTAMAITDSSGKKGGDYYTKEADIIMIKEGKVAVWSYWPERFFVPFLKQTKSLGYSVEEQDGGVIIMDTTEKETKPKAEKRPDAICEASKNEEGKLEEAQTQAIQSQTNEDLLLQMNERTIGVDADGLYDDQLERLIESALADGVLTDKEKAVLFKKAQSKGIDLEEFEMVLEARLYELNKLKEVDDAVTEEVVDFRIVKAISDGYKKQYESIDIREEYIDSEWVERKSKSGRVYVTNQLRDVKKIRTDEYETLQAQKDYLLSLSPQSKEETLAVIDFLSSFMPVTNSSEVGTLFLPCLTKYHNIVNDSRRLYSSDTGFMEMLKTVSKPFSRAEEIVDITIPKLKKQLSDTQRELLYAKFKLYAHTSFIVILYVAPWLLPLCGGKSIWWPIALNVLLLIWRFLIGESDLRKEKGRLENNVNKINVEIEEMERASFLLRDIQKK